MVDLCRILLKMDVVDANEFLRAIRLRNLHTAADAQGIAVFGNLVILGHIGVEIVFAVEGSMAADLAAEHKPAHNRQFYGFLIYDRQCTGIP